ncbi:MAG: DUF89 family protein [Campylobacteraceae bacterium]|nr:DUF89 family protein [Campylobacteraceae bacterium]
MKIHNDCLACIQNQANRVCELLHVDIVSSQKIEAMALRHIQNFDFTLTPPHNATPLYEEIASFLNVEDLYQEVKASSTAMAKKFIPFCENAIQQSSHKLLTATKTAVAGNVIDLASVMMYDLGEELEKIYHTDFAIDDFEVLASTLQITQTLVYLADNAGEEIFDKLYIQTICEQFPHIQVYYFVRGNPIINDLTCKDAFASGLNEVATIIDSGVPTPGLALELMNLESKVILDKAQCIISKGMGNYECLGEVSGLPIFFLLKVKCEVVAHAIGAKLGDIVCKKGIS